MCTRPASITTLVVAALCGSLPAACFTSSSGGSGSAGFDASPTGFGEDAGMDAGVGIDATTDGSATSDSSATEAAFSPEAGLPDTTAPETSMPDSSSDATTDASDGAPADSQAPSDAGTPSEAGLVGEIAAGTGLTWPEGLAVVGTTLYWLDSSDPFANNHGTMEMCDTSVGSCTPQLVPGMTSMPYNRQLATDGTTLFMTLGAPAHASDQIGLCSIAACTTTFTTAGSIGYWDDITGVAVDETNIYYAAGTPGSTYGIWIASKTGAAQTYSLVTGLPATTNVAVDANDVYFGEAGGGVYTCSLAADAAACTPTLLQATTATSGVAVDTTYLYWGDPAAGAVYRCPLAGCGASSPATIVTGQGHVNALAISGSLIFYSVGISVDAGLPDGLFGAMR
jgi:hypothetical protein